MKHSEGYKCRKRNGCRIVFTAINFLYENPEDKRKITAKYFLACNHPAHLEVGLIYCQVQGEYSLMNALIEQHKENSSLSIFLQYTYCLINVIKMN